MGSLCTSSPSTSTYTPNPAALQQYGQILGRANQVASTPYQAYTGQQVANLTPEQQAGISNVTNAYGSSSPFFNQASQYATTGAAPVGNLTSSDINQYYSPYQNDVINATMANINETNAQQQNQLRGSIASRGALGGDRQSVLQSELARQQGLAANQTLAGLQNQGFQTAAGLAQSQQANQQANANRAGQAAYTFGNLGNNVQNAATQGGFAQIAAGGVGQQNQQQQLSAAFNDYLRAQAFPYQQTGWLSGIAAPLLGATGGTQTNTPSQPSPLQTALGLGTAAAGLFTGNPFLLGGGLGGSGIGGGGTTGASGGGAPLFSTGGAVRASFGDAGPMPMSNGGLVDTIHALRHSIRSRYADGGKIEGATPKMFGWGSSRGPLPINTHGANLNVRSGVASGAEAPDDAIFDLTGNWKAVPRSPPLRRQDGGGVPSPYRPIDDSLNPRNWIGWQAEDGAGNPTTGGTFQPMQPYSPTSSIVPPAMAFAPEPQRPVNPLANVQRGQPRIYGADEPSPLGRAADDGNAPVNAQGSPLAASGDVGASPFGLGEDQRQGLLAAGLGILASKGPNAFAALGEGGLKGVTQMAQLRKEREDRALRQQHADVEARRLAQQAEQFAKTFGQHETQFAQTQQQRAAQLAEQKRQHDLQFGAGKVPPGFRVTPEGAMEAIPGGPHDPEVIRKQNAGKVPLGYRLKEDGALEPIPGGPHDPDTIASAERAKHNAAPLSQDAKEIGAWQIVRGNIASAMKGLGRGQQSDARMMELRNGAAEILVNKFGYSPQLAAEYLNEEEQKFKAAGIGRSAEARTVGVREGNLGIILRAADAAIPAALDASENVARTGWVPINRLIQKGEVIASDPRLKEFGMANLQLAEHWARAMNPTGVMRESDRDKALEFLSTADSKDTYRAAVAQLYKQIQREMTAVKAGKDSPMEGAPNPFKAEGGTPRTKSDTPKGGAPVRVQTPAEAAKLAPGTHYITPDGNEFTR